MIARHYKTAELAQLLGISEDALRAAVTRGELRPSRVGKDFIFPEDNVEAWLASTRVDNSSHSRVVPFRRQDRASTTSRRSA